MRRCFLKFKETIVPAVFIALSAVRFVDASCECGFSMSDSKDYFTHVIHNNFSTISPSRTLNKIPDFASDWQVQQWGIPPGSAATPLAIDNMADNVFVRDGNLVLRQQGYSKKDILKARNVSVASIATASGDIIHGSFRVELKMENAHGGSCGAFFWYRGETLGKQDDENEIDIEILAREFKQDAIPVHYTSHPSLDERGQPIKNATKVIPFRGDDLLNSFQRHRFDWTSKELRFYQNMTQVHTNSLRIPNASGHVYLNVWADGGMWTGPPSSTDVFLKVRSVAIYHNTSASDQGLDEAFNHRCEKAGGPSSATICSDTVVESGGVDPASIDPKSSNPKSSVSGRIHMRTTDPHILFPYSTLLIRCRAYFWAWGWGGRQNSGLRGYPLGGFPAAKFRECELKGFPPDCPGLGLEGWYFRYGPIQLAYIVDALWLAPEKDPKSLDGNWGSLAYTSVQFRSRRMLVFDIATLQMFVDGQNGMFDMQAVVNS
ncbi:hypothetical protein GX48_01410 [Paracoccidioides brasiliensis]|nr:hypothetical protein GX48_01410 [Paracoccidioides brasiliensis]